MISYGQISGISVGDSGALFSFSYNDFLITMLHNSENIVPNERLKSWAHMSHSL